MRCTGCKLPQSTIDDEAVERHLGLSGGPHQPMLPERLSNELCSLRPHETKPCFSAVFTLNENRHPLERVVRRTVIYSDRRFTHAEAQEVIGEAAATTPKQILTLTGWRRRSPAAVQERRDRLNSAGEIQTGRGWCKPLASSPLKEQKESKPDDRGVHAG